MGDETEFRGVRIAIANAPVVSGFSRTNGSSQKRTVVAILGERFDAAADERAHQAAAQFVGDLALIQRLGLELDPDGRRAVGQRFDAEDVERSEDERAPPRVAFHRRADLAHRPMFSL